MNIVLVGSIGYGNIGDTLLLERAIHDVRDVCADTPPHITVVTEESLWKRNAFHDVTRLPKNAFFPARTAFANAHAVIYVGYLFSEMTPRLTLLRIAYYNHLARVKGARIILYGCGFGPFTTFIRSLLAKANAKNVTHAALRDFPAQNALTTMNAGRAKRITKTHDILLGIPRDRKKEKQTRRHDVLLVVDPGLSRAQRTKIAELLEALTRAKIKVTIASFFPKEEHNLIEDICGMISFPLKIFNIANHFDIVHRLRNYSTLISTRYHAIIMGANEGCALFPLPVDGRLRELAYELGITHYSLDTLSVATLVRDVENALKTPPKATARYTGDENRAFLRNAIFDE